MGIDHKTYAAAMAFKRTIDQMKKELNDIHEEKITQEKDAMKKKETYLDSWNIYLKMSENEDNQRQKIINFVLGDHL
jgi:hypothetical protein